MCKATDWGEPEQLKLKLARVLGLLHCAYVHTFVMEICEAIRVWALISKFVCAAVSRKSTHVSCSLNGGGGGGGRVFAFNPESAPTFVYAAASTCTSDLHHWSHQHCHLVLHAHSQVQGYDCSPHCCLHCHQARDEVCVGGCGRRLHGQANTHRHHAYADITQRYRDFLQAKFLTSDTRSASKTCVHSSLFLSHEVRG